VEYLKSHQLNTPKLMYKKLSRFSAFFLAFALPFFSQAQNSTIRSNSDTTSRINSSKIKHYVVIQLTSNDSLVWRMLMNNIKNLKETYQQSIQIEVVTYGPGIEILLTQKTNQKLKIMELTSKNIAFKVCENTLKQRKIFKSEVLPEAVFVPSGVVELVDKQEKGWSYLKAGF